MERPSIALLKLLLPTITARACPARIPRTGKAGEAVNCFSSFVGEEQKWLLLSFDGDKLNSLEWDGATYSIARELDVHDVDPCTLDVTHFYGLAEIKFRGVWDLAFGRLSGWPYLKIWVARAWDSLAQRLFNRRTLAARKRLHVLSDVVDATLAGNESVTSIDLMTLWYGYRWAVHPAQESLVRELDKHLELLSDSGELKHNGTGYSATGAALRTLEEARDGEQKHRANLRVQRLLAGLTLVAAFMAAVQAGVVKLPTLIDLTQPARTCELHRAAHSRGSVALHKHLAGCGVACGEAWEIEPEPA